MNPNIRCAVLSAHIAILFVCLGSFLGICSSSPFCPATAFPFLESSLRPRDVKILLRFQGFVKEPHLLERAYIIISSSQVQIMSSCICDSN